MSVCLFFVILRLISIVRCSQPDLYIIKFPVNFQQMVSVAMDDQCLDQLFH